MVRKVASLLFVAGTVASLAVSSPQARRSGPGDGCLVVRSGKGLVTLSARGIVLGRFDQGSVTVDEGLPGGTVKVFGAARRRLVSETRTQYIGYDLRFRASGQFRVSVSAVFMDISAAGRGVATLAAPDFLETGTFSVDSDSFCEQGFQPLPDLPRRFVIGSQGSG